MVKKYRLVRGGVLLLQERAQQVFSIIFSGCSILKVVTGLAFERSGSNLCHKR